jgi:TetR/AcrR family transcriptional regulator, fatty acid metabolism regulator protein
MWSNNKTNDQNRPSFIENARRRQIIECTVETLAECGFPQTSLERIAQKAGISKGVILYYFNNKDTLILETAMHILSLDMEKAHQEIETAATAADKLKYYITHSLKFMQRHPKELKAVVEIITNLRTPDGHMYFDVRAADPALVELEEILKLGQQTGEFRQFNTHIMAICIRGSLDTAAARAASDDSANIREQAHELVEIFLRAAQKDRYHQPGQ